MACPGAFSQKQFTVTRPVLEVQGNWITINYEILNSTEDDLFSVSLEVTDEEGEVIQAKALSGDIGDNVRGSGKKRILWDLEEDEIFVNSRLNFQVLAQPIQPGDRLNDTGPASAREKEMLNVDISRSNAILRSVVFPGAGLTKVSGRKAHILKGIGAYAGLGSGIGYAIVSEMNYREYEQATNKADRDAYHKLSNRQLHISQACLITAAGIWAVDVLWTLGRSKGLDWSKKAQGNMEILPTYNIEHQAPVLAFRLTF